MGSESGRLCSDNSDGNLPGSNRCHEVLMTWNENSKCKALFSSGVFSVQMKFQAKPFWLLQPPRALIKESCLPLLAKLLKHMPRSLAPRAVLWVSEDNWVCDSLTQS